MTDVSGGRARVRMDRKRRYRALSILVLALASGAGAARLEASIDVTLAASPRSPEPVGTMIRWTAEVSSMASDNLWYRFRVREHGGAFRMIRDYGPVSTLDWTSIDQGVYEIEVSVRDRDGLETATTVTPFLLQSRVEGSQAVVSPTSHPLVFLYSAPPCETGRARVRFESAGGLVQHTPYKSCAPGRSLNFYLAGLAPNASYSASLAVDREGDTLAASAATFSTSDVPYVLAAPTVLQAPAVPGPERILLLTPLFLPPLATDLNGTLLWVGPPGLSYLTHPEPGGTFFGLANSRTDPAQDVVRRFDVVGMTVQETNAARVNEQLAAMGRRAISGFHHEARSLRDGKTVVLGAVEQILTDVQGPGPVDVIGDMILVLDADLQVVWAWDTFDHLDPSRRAVLGETCPEVVGCPVFYLAARANDWTHGNSVSETPDGALLFSIRHLDWLVKIDYRGGAGNGDVIWRLGKDGDFTYDSADPYPWFSHQHDASYEPGSRSTITVLDNGNTRVGGDPLGTSRGQAIELDEENRIARLVLNADLGVYAPALGSAQRLRGGDYLFNAGFVFDLEGALDGAAYSIQADPAGSVVSSIKLLSPVYRSFRVDDLYGPEEAPARPRARVVDFRGETAPN